MSKRLLAASLLPVAAMAAPQQTEQPMVVTATRFAQPVASVLAPVNIVTRDEIDRLQVRTVTEVVRTLPGVEISSTGGRGQNATALVRGTTSSQTLILIDGVRTTHSALGSVNLNGLPLSQVERIEYIRGARASIYGSDAIGGVINIITRSQPGESRQRLNGSLGSHKHRALDGSSSFDTGAGAHLKLAAGYEDEAGYNVHPVPGVNDGDQHGFNGRNALVDYQQALANQWSLFATGRWFQTVNQYDLSTAYDWFTGLPLHERDEAWEENQHYQLGVRQTGDRYQTELQGNLGRQFTYNYPDSLSRSQADSRAHVDQYHLSWLNNLMLTPEWTLGAGADWRKEILTADSLAYGAPYSAEDFPANAQDIERENTGLYALAQYERAAWTAELSGRSDDNQQYGRHNTWQAGAGWAFLPAYRLGARYGTAFHAPTFSDLYFPYSASPDLQPEQSTNRELSLEGTNAGLFWRITGYDNRIDQLIQWSPDSSGFWRPANVGRARIKGVELEAEFATGFIDHRLSADFKDAQDLDTDTQLIRRAKRNYKWVAQTEWQRLEGALTWLYQGRRPEIGGVILPSYGLWELGLGYKVTDQLTLRGRVENLFNKEYEIARGYQTPGRGYFAGFNYQL